MSSHTASRSKMKPNVLALGLTLIAAALTACETAVAPTASTSAAVATPHPVIIISPEDENNPAFTAESTDSWESEMRTSYVVFKNGLYHMFYAGADLANGYNSAIMYATSSDGFTFTQREGNPILEGDGSGFDAERVFEPVVAVDGHTWLLYYAAQPGQPRTVPALGGEPDWSEVIPGALVVDEGYAMYYTLESGLGGGGVCGMTTRPLSC